MLSWEIVKEYTADLRLLTKLKKIIDMWVKFAQNLEVSVLLIGFSL